MQAKNTGRNSVENWYFTFGFGQQFPNGYVKISAASYGEAREEMVRQYGDKWAFQYSEEKFLPQLERWPLWEVK